MKQIEFTNNTKNEYIRISNSVNGNNEIEIQGEIGQSWFSDGYTLEKFKSDLSRLNGKIVINIASYGGNLFEALAIYDHIRSLKNKVVTKIVKSSASAATVISLAGDKRYITKNSRYLIHKPMVMLAGNSDDFEAALEQLKDLDKQTINLYVERTNLSEEEVLNLMKEEKFISAEEAIQMGFVDDYVGDKKFENNNTNIKSEDMTQEIYDMLQVSNDAEAKDKIVSMLNVIAQTNNVDEQTTERATEDVVNDATEEITEVENVVENREVVENTENVVEDNIENSTEETTEVENNTEIDASQERATEEVIEEVVNENTDEVINKEDDEDEEDDVEKLKAEIEDLKTKLKAKEDKEKEEDENNINNFINNIIQSKKIEKEAEAKWREIASDKGLEYAENLINSISVSQTKLSSLIENKPYTQKEIYAMWKSGQITGEEYLKLKK